MTRSDIKELITKYLKKEKYREISTGWIMTSCPFAQWTHPDGDDKRFSFGISVRNGFHCFTCGMKGHILQLPKKLCRFTHLIPYDMEDFIRSAVEYEDFDTYRTKDASALDKKLLESFNEAEECLSFTKEDIRKWEIKQYGDSLLFPVFDKDKRLVAIKVRLIGTKTFYYLSGGDMKNLGIWYGEQFRPRKVLALVEGERDAILLGRYMTAWASLGTPTKAQIQAIKNLPVKVIVLFFDDDNAGRQTFNKVTKELAGLFTLYKVKDYLGCKDPAELVEKNLINRIKFVKI